MNRGVIYSVLHIKKIEGDISFYLLHHYRANVYL